MPTNYLLFQAEDGIRVGHVTGVQTCALPISVKGGHVRQLKQRHLRLPFRGKPRSPVDRTRSEERRVGKECRSSSTPYPPRKGIQQTKSPIWLSSTPPSSMSPTCCGHQTTATE